MGWFVGIALLVLAYVLWFWLRRLTRATVAIGAVLEATVNRAARIRGDNPVSSDIDTEEIYRGL